MMNIKALMIAVLAWLLTGCVSSIEYDGAGNIVKITGESLGMAAMNAQSVDAVKDAGAICQSESLSEIAKLSASGQVEYFRNQEKCNLALLVAAARNNPLSAQGEVAGRGSAAIQAAEASEAAVARSAASVIGTLGLGYVAGKTVEAVAEAASGDTYTVNGVQQSNSVNTSASTTAALGSEEEALAGAPGSSVGADGARSNIINIGPGVVNSSNMPNSPSGLIQHNNAGGQVDKPVAQDCATCAINDDDGGNETSLF